MDAAVSKTGSQYSLVSRAKNPPKSLVNSKYILTETLVLTVEKHSSGQPADGSGLYETLMTNTPTQDVREAIRDVALFFLNGEPVQKNESWAFDLYKLAADLGDIPAMHKVAEMYGQGVGVNQNISQELYYLGMVESIQKREFDNEGKYQNSLFNVAKLLAEMGDFEEILNLVSQGDVDSMLYLSDAYQRGKGVSKDENQAEQYLESAGKKCKPDDAKQNYEIGIRYFKRAEEIGNYSPINSKTRSALEKALTFFKVASQSNHGEAYFHIWRCYRLLLVHTSYGSVLSSRAWPALKKAAELECPNAMYEIGKIYFEINTESDAESDATLSYIGGQYRSDCVDAKKKAHDYVKKAIEAKVPRAASFLFAQKEHVKEWTSLTEAKTFLETAAYDYKFPADLLNLGYWQLIGKDPGVERNLEEGFDNCLLALQRANELGGPLGESVDAYSKITEGRVLGGVECVLDDKEVAWDTRACTKLGGLLTAIKTLKESRDKIDTEIQRVDSLLGRQKELSKGLGNKTDPLHEEL